MPAHLLLAFLALPLLAGCTNFFGDKDAHQPGETLGSYHVTAKRTTDSCGDGALGNQAAWEFDVKLARSPGQLFWNNGQEIISGTVDGDGTSFRFDTGVLMNMRGDGDQGLPACSLRRKDEASGELGAAGSDVASFDGTLSYEFAPEAGSSCADLVEGSFKHPPILAALPCALTYDIAGARVDPKP